MRYFREVDARDIEGKMNLFGPQANQKAKIRWQREEEPAVDLFHVKRERERRAGFLFS